eukprot:1132973-Pleurochrysis_carterae.AAC.1
MPLPGPDDPNAVIAQPEPSPVIANAATLQTGDLAAYWPRLDHAVGGATPPAASCRPACSLLVLPPAWPPPRLSRPESGLALSIACHPGCPATARRS